MSAKPEVLEESEKPPSAAAMKRLGEISVQELDGNWIELRSLWEDRPAAIIFLRHYG